MAKVCQDTICYKCFTGRPTKSTKTNCTKQRKPCQECDLYIYICIFYNDGNTEPLGMLGTNRGLVRHRTRGIPIIAWAFGIFATSTIFTPKAFAMSFLTGQPISANCSFAESHLDRTGDQSRAQLNKKAGKAPSLRVALNRFSGF